MGFTLPWAGRDPLQPVVENFWSGCAYAAPSCALTAKNSINNIAIPARRLLKSKCTGRPAVTLVQCGIAAVGPKRLLLECRLSARMAFRRLSILMLHGSDWERFADAEPLNPNALGGRQAGKAPGFGPGIRRF